jgi:hypothetical protein
MSISSIGASTNANTIVPPKQIQPQNQPETLETRTASGRDSKVDGDADGSNGTATTATATVKPTVNTQGQQLGQLLNTKA